MSSRIRERWARIACYALLLGMLAGCGGPPDGPQRIPVTGTVKREGHLVDAGSIIFRPQAGGGGVDVSAATEIKSGHYVFSEKDGPPPGKYKVEIVAFPRYDPSYVGKRVDAPILADDRFKNKMPRNGWVKEADVPADAKNDVVLDFSVE